MAVGYTDTDGKFVFENRHAGGFVTPQVSDDQKDNMRLKESHQENGVTSFVFEKRNTAACITEQMNVMKDAWQWFIYAHSSVNTFAQHAPGNMGKQYIKLGDGKTVSVNEVRPVADTKNLTIAQPEMTVPTDETTYCYTLHKLPAGKKNYIVGERPKKSSELMHHLVIYACYNMADEYLDMVGKEPNCNWKTFSNPCNGFVTECEYPTAMTTPSSYSAPPMHLSPTASHRPLLTRFQGPRACRARRMNPATANLLVPTITNMSCSKSTTTTPRGSRGRKTSPPTTWFTRRSQSTSKSDP